MTSSRCACRHAGNAPSRSVSGIKLARGPPVIMIASVMFYALYPLSRLLRRASGKKLTVLQHERSSCQSLVTLLKCSAGLSIIHAFRRLLLYLIPLWCSDDDGNTTVLCCRDRPGLVVTLYFRTFLY